MKRLFQSFASLLFILSHLIPYKVFATASQVWTDSKCQGGPGNDVATIQCLEPLFQNVVTAVVQLAGVALFFMFIIGGFQFLTGGGNPKQLEQARHTITYAIIGLVVIVSAYLILLVIGAITGVDVTVFTVPGATK